jgi:hypothetical protein
LIEAGCSFSAAQIQGDIGSVHQVSCPANCGDGGGLWGSDLYTADSSICKAAIHAGAIAATGGVVSVRIDPGRPAYRGSSRNGVQSSDYGSYPKSFAVLLAEGQAPVAQPSQLVEAGCSFNGTQLQGEPGAMHTIACPPGCAAQGGLWGTDVYTADSAVCRAAIHAGLASEQAGGQFSVILEPGRPAYRGSSRNGVQSSDYGNYGKSYRLAPPPR